METNLFKIGLPNAGKSSLLNALTRARPKIGAYSFTTLHPHVGVAEYEDFMQISLADFPGLLPDLTRGLGPKFLHHLEKSKMLAIVVDISLPTAHDDYLSFCESVNAYDRRLLNERPSIVIANKVDKLDESVRSQTLDAFRLSVESGPIEHKAIIAMSAKEEINLRKFLVLLRSIYEQTLNDEALTMTSQNISSD